MSEVEQLEKAVKNLPEKELRKFRNWFESYTTEKWDDQIESDAFSGKFDKLAGEAISDFKKGNYREM